MLLRSASYRLLIPFVLIAAVALPVLAKDEWLPISKEDLALKDVPQNPGAHAVILYKSDVRVDGLGYDEMYYRIKILSEEGKKYANVDTGSYTDSVYRIEDIKARTIRPDGSIVPFEGKIFEKVIAKRKGYSVKAKTFTMPDVQVGSIIEYKYRQKFDTYTALFSGNSWRVQEDLFTLKAHFSFIPGPSALQWVIVGVPPESSPKQQKKDNAIVMDLENIEAFDKESYMPPEDEMRAHVYFYYVSADLPKDVEEFWRKEGKEWRKTAEDYMDKRGAMQKEVAAVLKPEDATNEAKMRRLYDRVQKIRNLTYERDKTEKEEQKENLKDNNNVEDVLKHGYGYHNSINRLYAALLRAAGIDAALMKVSERDDQFFHRNIPIWGQLTSELVVARDGSKELFLDPGIPYCPFGLLSWEDTGAEGVRIDKDGTSFFKTPQPIADNAVTTRKAQLRLDREGTLTGTLQLSFSGIEALRRRLGWREDDDTQRKKDLEEEVKGWLPAGATVELTRMDGWSSGNVPLSVDLKLTVPGFAAVTGKRILLTTSVLHGQDRNPFQHAKRVTPVYFHYPFLHVDDVTITLPERAQVENTPAPQSLKAGFGSYDVKVEKSGADLHVTRQFRMDGVMFKTEYYPALQQFYGLVRAGDDQQAILRTSNAASGK